MIKDEAAKPPIPGLPMSFQGSVEEVIPQVQTRFAGSKVREIPPTEVLFTSAIRFRGLRGAHTVSRIITHPTTVRTYVLVAINKVTYVVSITHLMEGSSNIIKELARTRR